MMEIRVDDLSGQAISRLLAEHGEDMRAHSPPESVHTLNLDALKSPLVTLWCAWDGGELAGCGALKELGRQQGEIKSMRTSGNYLRQGVGTRILSHLIEQARLRSYQGLWLETGTPAVFLPARKMYEKYGFEYCSPFAQYREDPYSVFMCKRL